MRETDDGNICRYCGGDENKPANPRHLPPNTAIGDRYIVGRALNQTEDAIIYAALDQRTQERIRIYEYYPRQLARRDARTLEVAPVPGSEQAFTDGMESMRARMEGAGCRLYEGNGSIYAAVSKEQAAVLRGGAAPAPSQDNGDMSGQMPDEDDGDIEELDADAPTEEELDEQEYEDAEQRRRNRIIMGAIGAGCVLFLILGIWMLTRDSVDQRTDTLPTLLPQASASASPVPSPSASASAGATLPTPDPSTGFRPLATDSPSWVDDDSAIDDDDDDDTHVQRPTRRPTGRPTDIPTPKPKPTSVPTAAPTNIPTPQPTLIPTEQPKQTEAPTAIPTEQPQITAAPTEVPTIIPTAEPVPTEVPTEIPTAEPAPTELPTVIPTEEPVPTEVPTEEPTAEPEPTEVPTEEPTAEPEPTEAPTEEPTVEPEPTEVPTEEPTAEPEPTEVPTEEPTAEPEPTEIPTEEPTVEPEPTEEPTPEPTMEPSQYTSYDYMPQGRMKYVLNDGRELWTMTMDDGVTVMVRTYMPDGSEKTWYYAANDDGMYRYSGYNDGSSGELVVRSNPAIGSDALGGKAHVVEILEEGVLLDNGDMVLTGIGIVPAETSISQEPTQLTDDELAKLQGLDGGDEGGEEGGDAGEGEGGEEPAPEEDGGEE